MDALALDSVIRLAIILIGFFLSLAVIDLKGKVKALDKLSHIDTILKDLKGVVTKLNELVTKQEVGEISTTLKMEYIEKELLSLTDRVKKLEGAKQ